MTDTIDPRRICIIGCGEAGGIMAQGLAASGRHEVATYDILFGDNKSGAAMIERARGLGALPCASAAEAARGARLVISAVTAAADGEVAREAGGYMVPGQIFVDINSVSPETKRSSAAAVERSGAAFVEAAVMAPVPPQGMKVPILLGGGRAGEVEAMLNAAGMSTSVAGAEIGRASAIKMCRSIMIKGVEALAVECFLTARRYGVEDTIVASLDKTFPLDWEKLAGYLVGRVIHHGKRRAQEMREVAGTVADIGLDPLMPSATAERHDWLAALAAAHPELKEADDAAWRQTLDRVAALMAASAKAAE
jgi:3-hydroxyisobutyrate dehydrogenase-like beta-hydroxyacid dehydrogenase